MKIEKISDTQIRCTLDKEDLLNRELRISELAYGSEKAKALFRDMMQQASYELGFEAEDIPLMIEAIPVSQDCLVLVITKVEDPDELDTRFSNFTPFAEKDELSDDTDDNAYADELLNCCEQMSELFGSRDLPERKTPSHTKKADGDKSSIPSDISIPFKLTKIFSFPSLEEVIQLSKIIKPFYHGENTLYKDENNCKYYLTLLIADHKPEEFNKVCNIVSEYGRVEKNSYATIPYFEEHLDKIVSKKAIQVLSAY